jgi:hypothetical protein
MILKESGVLCAVHQSSVMQSNMKIIRKIVVFLARHEQCGVGAQLRVLISEHPFDVFEILHGGSSYKQQRRR